ncbi:uncharacterized protein LOC110861471 isoform X1 [Folsomia candida]|uniref:uncharacterized protein LOC110861471 isoform X1 n=1 Tax=Folsomia candida TaxID=158441 RepID=UPI000B8FDF5F|nr:uncharacterized protein LOC110861471 isoform X1 [Folsomia candida]
MSLKLIFASVLIMMISNVHGQSYVSFYGERHCSGERRFGAELQYSCQNLPTFLLYNWQELSMDTNGECVTVYNERNCGGRELANFNSARCRNIFAIGQVKSFRQCSGRTNSAFISG